VPGTPGAAYSTTITGYDALYDVTGSTISIPTGAPGFGGTSYTYAATFNADGTPASRTIPAMGGLASEKLKYPYDAVGKQTSVVGASVYASLKYTAIGQLGQILRSGTTSLYTSLGYDVATGAITDINDTTALSGVGTLQADRTYTRTDDGDVTKIATTGAAGADTQCFGYDYLHDLTQAWTPSSGDCTAAPTAATIGGAAPYWTSYTIDPATGNRTAVTQNPTTGTGTATTDTYAYPASGASHPHAVQTVTHRGTGTTDSYGYDADGNTTTRPGQTLTYDATGKLSTVAVGAASQTSIYDPTGTLLLQSDPTNGTTLFLGETELHVAAGSSAVSAVRTYGYDGTPIAERSTTPGGTTATTTFVSGDANHTQDIEVNPITGAVVRRFADPYGNVRGTAATWSSGHGYLNAPTNTFASESLLGARAYDPTIGKFLSVDSVLSPSNPQQNNGYAYALNSPITQADPSGNEPTNPNCTTAACRNAYYGAPTDGDGTDISNAPAAAGNETPDTGSVHISPQISVSSKDPAAAHLKKDYELAKRLLAKSLTGPQQEANIWSYICQYEDPAACGADFAAVILSGGAAWSKDLNGEWHLRAPSTGGTSIPGSKTFWNDKDGNWRIDGENPNGGAGNVHLQSRVLGKNPKYYYDFAGKPGANNWYTEDGEHLPVKVFKQISDDRTYARDLGKATEAVGGVYDITSLEPPSESGAEEEIGAP
jgi:RHS repeat-associated protein